jgi:Xaa-Pro dipeptidase
MTHTSESSASIWRNHFDLVSRRYSSALESLGYRAALLHSGSPPMRFEDEQSHPYRAKAPFKGWLPLTGAPESFLYFEPGRRPVLLFHSPRDYWHRPSALPQGPWLDAFEVREIEGREAARALLPADLSKVAFLGEIFPELSVWGVGEVNPRPLMTRLDYQRAIKTPYEIECLRQASRMGARGHKAAAQAFAGGGSEFQIELAFLAACGQREQDLPYNPIIALNEGAAVLHYQLLEQSPPSQHHSMLIDAGCEFAGYASDITRTYSAADADFSALIDQMDEVQQSLCASVRPGVDWKDVHLLAHRLIADLLLSADIITCEADEAMETGLSSVFFPHGLGHLLGLQVHDVGGLLQSPEGGEIARPPGHPFLRLTRRLEEGYVVTMEPGLYFIDMLLEQARADARGGKINWARVEQFRKFGGIRIEDNLALTQDGCENLTRDAFDAN